MQWPFHPMLPQGHVKDSSHSAKSAGGRLHLNMHTPLTNELGVDRLCCPGIVWEPISETSSHTKLAYNSQRNTRPVVSAHWAIVNWPWLYNWCATADFHFKNKSKNRPGVNYHKSSPKPSYAREYIVKISGCAVVHAEQFIHLVTKAQKALLCDSRCFKMFHWSSIANHFALKFPYMLCRAFLQQHLSSTMHWLFYFSGRGTNVHEAW